ncbi:LysE family translocator [Kitasatospora kifunensis]|uniref:Threonine/homoserine/homoserine lactone efflux protein n=1 Tax=Kitasatospora kifunensis TaxID=58351 RepID=A0A7W7R536_KITKI|nr:LysE family translocator [Kitasatospora kifunensis]MBB4925577.1 threonine/homoserine/homoserine lactone efflux protein [Kitasatospora kifunensis]
MTAATALWSFAAVVGLLTLTPGLDTALILRTSALGLRRRAWGVVLGVQTGTLIWGSLTSLGVTALLTASQLAYQTLRWVGAGYLVWMGARMLLSTWRRRTGAATGEPHGEELDLAPGGPDRLLPGWRQGTVTNLLNPKVGVFYVALLPQFVPPAEPHLAFGLLLTSVHVLFGLLWSAVLIAFATALRERLRRPAARRLMDRITGIVVIGFGLRLVLGD